MTGAELAQLIIMLGPVALDLAPKLAAVWTTNLTPEQVNEYCNYSKKAYETYIAEAKSKLVPPVTPPPAP